MIYWGSTIDTALENAVAEAKNAKSAAGKQAMVLNRYLGIRKFRDPAVEGPRRVKSE